MTAVIIIVLHLKTWAYLPIRAASLNFRRRDVCGNIMGAFFIGCGTDCRRYTNLTLHIMELVMVSRSSSIQLR